MESEPGRIETESRTTAAGERAGASDPKQVPRIVVIAGPTAAGKSRLALALAPEFSADIVSADSRQIYRYTDVATAKPSLEERSRVRHYMLDLIEPSEAYSAQRFREEGGRVLRRITAAGRVAFVVGGTGFYIRALLDGIALPEVPPDPEVRARLRAEAEDRGAEALHHHLARVDPASAERIDARNLPRVIRALEIVEKTGRPVPSATDGQPLPALRIGLTADRTALYRRSDERVLLQLEAGLVEETRVLLDMGYGPENPGLAGFGYREMVMYLRGELSLEDAVAAYQRATRQYIRRQMTWFRAQPGTEWVDVDDDPLERARRLIEAWLADV